MRPAGREYEPIIEDVPDYIPGEEDGEFDPPTRELSGNRRHLTDAVSTGYRLECDKCSEVTPYNHTASMAAWFAADLGFVCDPSTGETFCAKCLEAEEKANILLDFAMERI